MSGFSAARGMSEGALVSARDDPSLARRDETAGARAQRADVFLSTPASNFTNSRRYKSLNYLI